MPPLVAAAAAAGVPAWQTALLVDVGWESARVLAGGAIEVADVGMRHVVETLRRLSASGEDDAEKAVTACVVRKERCQCRDRETCEHTPGDARRDGKLVLTGKARADACEVLFDGEDGTFVRKQRVALACTWRRAVAVG